MSKLQYNKLAQLLVIIIFAVNLTTGKGKILYEKTWSTSRGSELKIEVTPNTANFKAGEIYSYTFTLTAIKFGTDADRFHEIAAYVQFLNALEPIVNSKGNYEISSIGSSLKVVVDLIIPPKETLNLEAGDSLTGKLQIRVNFKEGVVLAIDPSYSTGWENIVNGKISLPPDNSMLFILGGAGMVIVVGGILIYFATRPKKQVMRYDPPAVQPKTQLINGMQFCPNCGQSTESAIFCSSCGSRLKKLDVKDSLEWEK